MTDEADISIDSQQLESIVADILDEQDARLGEWQVKPLHGSLDIRNRLMHIFGQARTSSGERPWSLVLKIICPESGIALLGTDLQSVKYWKREILLYQSGMLNGLPCSIAAPRCYHINQNEDEYWLWLEEVKDDLNKPWPLEHYREVARCLGCFNGAYLAGKPLPGEPWLSRQYLRKYAEAAGESIQDLPALRKLSFFQQSYPLLSNEFLLEAWEQRGEFLEVLERLPQTFCHLDAFEGNLFWRHSPIGQGQLVGIDWGFAGIAALGEELAPLVVMASHGMTVESTIAFQQTCMEGYLAGLAESGYIADPKQVLFSSLTATFYRYLFVFFSEGWPYLRDKSNHPIAAARFGFTKVDQLFNMIASMNEFLLEFYKRISLLLKQFS